MQLRRIWLLGIPVLFALTVVGCASEPPASTVTPAPIPTRTTTPTQTPDIQATVAAGIAAGIAAATTEPAQPETTILLPSPIPRRATPTPFPIVIVAPTPFPTIGPLPTLFIPPPFPTIGPLPTLFIPPPFPTIGPLPTLFIPPPFPTIGPLPTLFIPPPFPTIAPLPTYAFPTYAPPPTRVLLSTPVVVYSTPEPDQWEFTGHWYQDLVYESGLNAVFESQGFDSQAQVATLDATPTGWSADLSLSLGCIAGLGVGYLTPYSWVVPP